LEDGLGDRADSISKGRATGGNIDFSRFKFAVSFEKGIRLRLKIARFGQFDRFVRLK
jgi:hypothetical protein